MKDDIRMINNNLWGAFILIAFGVLFVIIGGYFLLIDNYYISTYSYMGACLSVATSYLFYRRYVKNGN